MHEIRLRRPEDCAASGILNVQSTPSIRCDRNVWRLRVRFPTKRGVIHARQTRGCRAATGQLKGRQEHDPLLVLDDLGFTTLRRPGQPKATAETEPKQE